MFFPDIHTSSHLAACFREHPRGISDDLFRVLISVLRCLPSEAQDSAVFLRFFPVPNACFLSFSEGDPEVTFYVVEEGSFRLQQLRETGCEILLVSPLVFSDMLRLAFGGGLVERTTHWLARYRGSFSAFFPLTSFQKICFFWVISLLLFLSFSSFFLISCVLLGLFFLILVAKIVPFFYHALTYKSEKQAKSVQWVAFRPKEKSALFLEKQGEDYPIYTVLVPLFLELSVVKQLLVALDRLDYPKVRLDIKLIIEEDDAEMRRFFETSSLSPCYEIIIVPRGGPQTKPRALNYALAFARGEFVTVFDAEDIPSPDQLKKAVEKFSFADQNVACLQAQLTFYNANETWLTRQYTLEYGVLFGCLLPFLAHYGFSFPLGGTSNHFRVAILREIGAWDPHNVTEDADLGIRLGRLGYRAEVLENLTFEEANTSLKNWFFQRSRWLQGFLQTWIVHMRFPRKTLKELGGASFLFFQLMIFGSLLCAFLHPFALISVFLFYIHSALTLKSWSFSFSFFSALFILGYAIPIMIAYKTRTLYGYRLKSEDKAGLNADFLSIFCVHNKKMPEVSNHIGGVIEEESLDVCENRGFLQRMRSAFECGLNVLKTCYKILKSETVFFISLLCIPVYWLCISAAFWVALWRWLHAPHVWYKSQHGTSRAPLPEIE